MMILFPNPSLIKIVASGNDAILLGLTKMDDRVTPSAIVVLADGSISIVELHTIKMTDVDLAFKILKGGISEARSAWR